MHNVHMMHWGFSDWMVWRPGLNICNALQDSWNFHALNKFWLYIWTTFIASVWAPFYMKTLTPVRARGNTLRAHIIKVALNPIVSLSWVQVLIYHFSYQERQILGNGILIWITCIKVIQNVAIFQKKRLWNFFYFCLKIVIDSNIKVKLILSKK